MSSNQFKVIFEGVKQFIEDNYPTPSLVVFVDKINELNPENYIINHNELRTLCEMYSNVESPDNEVFYIGDPTDPEGAIFWDDKENSVNCFDFWDKNNRNKLELARLVPIRSGCVQILKTGRKKGETCGCKIKSRDLCSRHLKLLTDEDKPTKIKPTKVKPTIIVTKKFSVFNR